MSEIKVNKISPRTACGTVTLGDSGDTFTIPSGATITNSGTASGFGATGSASWDTTVKTSTFTAAVGIGYFVNTTGGTITVNLPAGTAGDVIAVKDYANTFDTNACTIAPDGSEKIGGVASDATLETEGVAVTLVYIDSTQGWLVTDSGLQSDSPTELFITATGGTITTVCTNYKVHTFTGPGTFCVTGVGNAAGSNTVSYMVIAGGGGGGGQEGGGGGGAGGYREGRTPQCNSWTASPIACTSGSNNGLPVSVQGYPITVGAAGSAGCSPATPQRGGTGANSIFSTITSAGGGGGGTHPNPPCGPGLTGGSGGGGGARGGNTGAAGNTPSTTPAQGFAGGNSAPSPSPSLIDAGGGGGGATAVGANATDNNGAAGGAGATSSINATPTGRSGGGGGGVDPCAPGNGGPASSGGGAGGNSTCNGTAGTTNTGGGGGGSGGSSPSNGGAGGSGIVIIRYRFQ